MWLPGWAATERVSPAADSPIPTSPGVTGALAMLTRLAASGVRIVIDDFGG